MCKHCPLCYIGRTVQKFHDRVTEHRDLYYKLLSDPSIQFSFEAINDEFDRYSAGLHLINAHNCTDRADFNSHYSVFILMNSSPSGLEVNEHRLIHLYRTLKPTGINSVDPFGISLLIENIAFVDD